MSDINTENTPSTNQNSPGPIDSAERIADIFAVPAGHATDARDWLDLDGLKQIPGLVKSGDFEEALKRLEAYAPDFPDFDFIFAWQAHIYQKNKDFPRARRTLKNGLKKARSKHLLCERIGFWYYETDDIENAAKWWIKSIVLISRNHAHFLWEPFLYLSYVARGCGCDAESRILMDIAASKHGYIVLKPEAEKDLVQKAAALKDTDIPEAIIKLCKQFLANQRHLEEKSDPPQIPTDGPLRDRTAERPKSFSKPVFSRMGIAAGILLLLAACLVFFFSNSKNPVKKIENPSAVTVPAAEAPKALPSASTPRQENRIEKKLDIEPEPASPVQKTGKISDPPQKQDSSIPEASIKTARDISTPNKTKPSYLKQKTKQPAPNLQKKIPESQ